MTPRDQATGRDQQAARVNVGVEDWIEFRTLAMKQHRSVATYLGDLVRQELHRQRRNKPGAPPGPSRLKPRVRLSDQEILTSLPGRPPPQPPPWEE